MRAIHPANAAGSRNVFSFVNAVMKTGVDHNFVTGNLSIHGTTKRIHFPVTSLGTHEVPNVGKLAGFETTFTINRRDYGVLGNRWGAVPGVLSDEVELHITIGAVTKR